MKKLLVSALAALLSTCAPLLADPPTTTHQSVWTDGNQTITGTKNFTGTLQLNGVSIGSTAATFLGTPTSANLAALLSDETGSGLAVFGTAPLITNLNAAGMIADLNGNRILGLTPHASAVNAVGVENATTGNYPIIKAVGTDTNVNLDLQGRGTGIVTVGGVQIQTVNLTMPSGEVRTLSDVILERLPRPQDYGAIADGSSHPLSGSYGSLALAQAAYSFTVENCTTTNTSTTVSCDSTTPLRVGFPISGTGIPAGATVSSITDSSHFVLSSAATATGTVTLTSSFVTALSQELDWAGWQACLYASGSAYLPPGIYTLGGDTIRTTTPVLTGGQDVRGDGMSIIGAGAQLVLVTSTGDALHILGRYQTVRGLSFAGPGNPATGTVTTAKGITLGEDNYSNNFHLSNVNIRNYDIGFDNPGDLALASGWDACSVDGCYFNNNFLGARTYSNQDVLNFTSTTIGNDTLKFAFTGATSNGSNIITVASTTGIHVGATISGTNIPARSYVSAITSSTTFTITANATGTGSGLTLHAATIGLYVAGSGAAHWRGGVSGGNGVAVVNEGTAEPTDVHFEGADQTYCYSGNNTNWVFTNPQFSDGNASLFHLEVGNGSQVRVMGATVANSGLGYPTTDIGLMYVLTHGNVTVFSADHTAVEDYNGAMQVIAGDYFIQSGDNALPAAGAAYRGKRYYQGNYPFYSGPDHIYTCMSIGGSYFWVRDDGLATTDTAGSVATITAAGTTGAQTINRHAGSVNFAAGATSLVVTDSLVTANSVIMATVATDDATLVSVKAIPAAGSFTLKSNAAATAETRVQFRVLPN